MNTSKNKVQLVGNLGFDPEVREIDQGHKVARMSIATNETYQNAKGERVTDTQWHTVVAWGQTAEQCENLLRKGMAIAIEGRLVHRSYTSANGDRRYVAEVVMSNFNLLPKQKPDAAAMIAERNRILNEEP